MKYKVWADYGYVSEILLYEADSRSEAEHWLERYMRDGFGGYVVLEVAYHTDSGEYVTVASYSADDVLEEDWDRNLFRI